MRRRDVLRLAGAGIAGLGAVGTAVSAEPYEPLGSVAVEGAKEAVVGGDGTVAYVAATDGFATVDVSDPTAPGVLAERRGLLADREGGPLADVWDVTVDGDRLLVVGPAHGGELSAALLYDVRDPAAPERLAVHETDFPIHNGFLVGERAYLTGNDGIGNPLVIVDMAAPEEVGRWSPVDRDDGWLAVSPRLRPIHDIWVHDGTAYCCYWDAGTWIVDVSDPEAPAYRGRIGGRARSDLVGIEDPGVEATELPGNHHYAATDASGSLLAIGREAWRVGADGPGPGGIDLWDVSDPAEPARLSTIDPPPTPDPTYGGVWTTAHNFDLHGGRLYSVWYQGGVKLHDVRDPTAPERLAWWRRPEAARFWTAQHSAGGVVASDMGVDGGSASIYTFPDRPGEQPDPPSLTPTPTPTPTPTETPSPTASPTPTPTATPTPTPTPTPSPSPTPTPTDTPSPTDSPTPTPTGTPASAPGFGPLAALAGLGLAAYRWTRSEDAEETE